VINTTQLVKKINKIIKGSKVEPEYYFNKYCSDASKDKMVREDFNKLVKHLYEKVSNRELMHIFGHFDLGGKGYIDK